LAGAQFAAALAVIESLRELDVHDAMVKWPNDIWVWWRATNYHINPGHALNCTRALDSNACWRSIKD
jgi:hypothetical protein